MSWRGLEGTHRFLHFLVCDRCGFKVVFGPDGRAEMKDHLATEHGRRPS